MSLSREPLSAFVDDPEFPFEDWCEDEDIKADDNCPWCDYTPGLVNGQPCDCLITAALDADPEAAADAFPIEDCPRCDGDGEDIRGAQCPCVLVGFIEHITNRLDDIS